MQIKTASGIQRPTVAVFVGWERARSEAKSLNETRGRGHRALRSADGKGYSVIFRPAVAGNKQRKTREIA